MCKSVTATVMSLTVVSLLLLSLAFTKFAYADEPVAAPAAVMPAARRPNCGTSILRVLKRMLQFDESNWSSDRKRYPASVNPTEHPDWHLMFGFESEYTI